MRVLSSVCHLRSESHKYIKYPFHPWGVPARINVRHKHIFYRRCEDGRPLVSSCAQRVSRNINRCLILWFTFQTSTRRALTVLSSFSSVTLLRRHCGSVLPTRFSRWYKGSEQQNHPQRLHHVNVTATNVTATDWQKNWNSMLFFSNKTNNTASFLTVRL